MNGSRLVYWALERTVGSHGLIYPSQGCGRTRVSGNPWTDTLVRLWSIENRVVSAIANVSCE